MVYTRGFAKICHLPVKRCSTGPDFVGPRFIDMTPQQPQASDVQLNSIWIAVQVFPHGPHEPSTFSWMVDTCGYHEELSINKNKRIQEIHNKHKFTAKFVSAFRCFYESQLGSWVVLFCERSEDRGCGEGIASSDWKSSNSWWFGCHVGWFWRVTYYAAKQCRWVSIPPRSGFLGAGVVKSLWVNTLWLKNVKGLRVKSQCGWKITGRKVYGCKYMGDKSVA